MTAAQLHVTLNFAGLCLKEYCKTNSSLLDLWLLKKSIALYIQDIFMNHTQSHSLDVFDVSIHEYEM